MTRIIILLTLLAPSAAHGDASEVQTVVKGNNQFACDLYRRINKKEGKTKNLFLSPYSISTALAMTYAGAHGETAAQMARVLHLRLPPKRLHPAFQELLQATGRAGKQKGSRIMVANALWGQRGYTFLERFLSLTRSSYGAGLQQVDFIKNTEGARLKINKWVEGKTHRRIKNLIPGGVLTAATRLVLTNAIYFKGTWDAAFEKRMTSDQPFYLLKGEARSQLMNKTAKFGYLKGRDFQALELPYKGKHTSMVVLLPQQAEGPPGAGEAPQRGLAR